MTFISLDPTLDQTLDHDSNEALASRWLNYLQLKRGRSKTTLYGYSLLIYAFTEYLAGKHVFAVNLVDLETFIERGRVDGQGPLAAATKRRDASTLRSFYQWAYEQHMTPVNVAIGLHTPTVHNKAPRAISDEHWMQLWSNNAVQMRPQAIVALGLGFYCGLRREEISSLRGDQITDEQIVAFKRKGGGEDTLPWRTMHGIHCERLPSTVLHSGTFPYQLQRLAKLQGSDRLLGWHSPDTFNDSLRRWCKGADTERVTPHQFRHSCATNLLRCGVPLHIVSSLLNHSSIQTTMRYVRAGQDQLAEWMDGQRDRGQQPERTVNSDWPVPT